MLVFAGNQELEGRDGLFVWRVIGLLGFRVAEILEAGHFFAARNIDNQVAGDGEQPGFEFGFGIVLMAAFEHANPGLLKKILGQFAIARKIDQIAQKPVLVLLDETV